MAYNITLTYSNINLSVCKCKFEFEFVNKIRFWSAYIIYSTVEPFGFSDFVRFCFLKKRRNISKKTCTSVIPEGTSFYLLVAMKNESRTISFL